MVQRIHNLVFEGGGVKGLAYLGALDVLEGAGLTGELRRVGGTSAGAIQATVLALGASQKEMEGIVWDLDLASFMDDSWGVVRDTARLLTRFGWYKGDAAEAWVADLVERFTGEPDTTFGELKAAREQAQGRTGPDLYLIATNLSTGQPRVLSHEMTPELSIARGVRMSMSIPLFFAGVREARDLYVDGGLLINYPVKLFDRQRYVEADDIADVAHVPDYYEEMNRKADPDGADPADDTPGGTDPVDGNGYDYGNGTDPYVFNPTTLGFRLDSAQEIAAFRDGKAPPRRDMDDIVDFTRALVDAVLDLQDRRHIHGDDWRRTVYIDTLGVRTTEFDLDDVRKEALVNSGREHAKAYVDWLKARG